MDENNQDKQLEQQSDTPEIMGGMRVVVAVVIIIAVLAGLYWVGKQLLVETPELTEEGTGRAEIIASCPKIYTDYKEAITDASENKDVCGLNVSGKKWSRIELGVSFVLNERLRVFEAADNWFEEIPEHVTHLTVIEYMDLRNNRITTIPEILGQLKTLKVLDLGGNPLQAGELDKARALLPDTEIAF